MSSLGTLSVDLVAKTGGFDKNLKSAQRRTETFDRKMQRFTRNMKRHFGSVVQSVKRLGLAFAGLGAAVGALVAKFSGMVEHLGDVAQQTGATAGQIEVLHRAASVAGTSVSDLDNTLARYSKRLGKAAQNTGPAIDALKDLGLSARDLVDKSLTDQLQILFKRLNALEDPTRRAADMDRIFGDSWKEMLPFVQAGAQGIQDAKQRLEELGGTITTDGVNKTANMRREFRKLANDIQTVLMKAVVELSPQIEQLAQYFEGIITSASKDGKITSFFKTIEKSLKKTKHQLDEIAKFGSNALIAKVFGLPGATVAMTAQISGAASGSGQRLQRGNPTEGDLGGLSTKRLMALRQEYISRANMNTKSAGNSPLGSDQNQAFQKAADKYEQAAQMIDRAIKDGPLVIDITHSANGPSSAGGGGSNSGGGGGGNGGGPGGGGAVIPSGMTEAERQNLQATQKSQDKFREWQGLQQQRKQGIDGLIQQFGTRDQAAQVWYDSQVERIHSLVGENQQADQLIANAHDQMIQRANAGTTSLGDAAADAAASIQGTLGSTLEQALGGNFKSIGDMWAKMLKKMAIKAIATGLIRLLFGGGGGGSSSAAGAALAGMVMGMFGGGKARGGPVSSSKAYLVGEKGPELFRPSQSGSIVPNHKMGSGSRGGVNQTFNVSYVESEGKSQQERDGDRKTFMDQLKTVAKQATEQHLGEMVGDGSFDKYMAPFAQRQGQI